jgi:hypothetical protein
MKKSTGKQMKSEVSLQQRDQQLHELEVSRRAYELWEAGGCQYGNDMAHWLEAEREVQTRRLQKGN